MMLPTHILVSLCFSLLFIYINPVNPVYATELLIAAIIGGIIPDLDMFIGQHRKTLHNIPLYIGLILLSLIGVINTYITEILNEYIFIIGLIIGLGAIGHILSDILGSGLEKKPWEKTSNHCVYNHFTKSWIAPTHIFGHDGSIRDLSLLLILSTIIIFIQPSQLIPFIHIIIYISIFIGFSYTVIRKKLPQLEEKLVKYPLINKFLKSLHGKELD